MYTCASCQIKSCYVRNLERLPKNCPCNQEKQEEIKALYLDEENHRMAYQSALVESSGYGKSTRVMEIIDFAKRCQYKKIGIAFCVGLMKEAQIFSQIIREHGFEVSSIICKNGSIPKEFIGIQEEQKVRPGQEEAMCNPIGQAILLNEEKVELNVLLGLCVGHDSLFIKYADAPVTLLGAKDRVTCHSPLAPLYLHESYYKKMHDTEGS